MAVCPPAGIWLPHASIAASTAAATSVLPVMNNSRSFWFGVGRIQQLKARPALELAFGVFARHRVDVALAALAQKTRRHREMALRRDLLAGLLEEDAADRCLA